MDKDNLNDIYEYVTVLHKEHRDLNNKLDTIFITISSASLPTILTIISSDNIFCDVVVEKSLIISALAAVFVILASVYKIGYERYLAEKISKEYYNQYEELSKYSDMDTYESISNQMNKASKAFTEDTEKWYGLQSFIYLAFTILVISFLVAIWRV